MGEVTVLRYLHAEDTKIATLCSNCHWTVLRDLASHIEKNWASFISKKRNRTTTPRVSHLESSVSKEGRTIAHVEHQKDEAD